MASKSTYLKNKLIDFLMRGQSFTPPATQYFALFRATAGKSPRSTAVTVGQTTVPSTSNGRMYRCSTAGTTGSSEPTWPTTSGGTVTDGTAVWTEMSADIKNFTSNLSAVEVTGAGYSRKSVAMTMSNFSGTQGAGTTVASSGTSGATSNNTAITFGAPSADWGDVALMYSMDSLTGGNPLIFSVLTDIKTVLNSNAAPSFPAASFTYIDDN